ncbi:MAG: glycosyltransferase [Solirubrobacterales bacterium]|nr:glycosyltransferase [Solirubrobacterales bacterium]
MRALIVTNMYPSAAAPARGSFVRDQVEALRRLPDVEVEVFAFEPGGGSPYPRAARALRRRYRDGEFDIVHAHFGLTAWSALAVRGARHVVTLHGTDVVDPRSRVVTFAALPFVDLIAPVSSSLASRLPPRLVARKLAILPCGVAVDRFRPIPRPEARARLGLEPNRRYVLFPADPDRAEKRFDRARAVAQDHRLLVLGRVPPSEVPFWVNAVDAVLVTSERESFGLSVLEALACDVPVLATDVGIAPEALADVPGTFGGPFSLPEWRTALETVLKDPDPRVKGRVVAKRYSADRMAERVLAAWQGLRRPDGRRAASRG